MSRKRRNTSSPEPDDSPPPAKRRPSPSLYRDDVFNTKEQPRLHEETGLQNAFPGLGTGDEVFYGPALDGIDYLRMVRSEASTVPKLLSVTRHEETVEEEEKDRYGGTGIYIDGVYAAPEVQQNGDNNLSAAQTRYYETLLAQFRLVQTTLRCTPPLEAIQALQDTRPISFPSNSPIASKAWQRHILRHDPHPVQLVCIDMQSLFELFLLFKKLLRSLPSYTEAVRRRLGAWIWACIGRFPDRGELGSDEIARMRDLAAAAVALLRDGGEDGEVEVEVEVEVEDDDEVDEDEDGLVEFDSLIEAANRVEAVEETIEDGQSDREEEIDSGHALADMILTVVGEAYGQRDLLDLRTKWVTIRNGDDGLVVDDEPAVDD